MTPFRPAIARPAPRARRWRSTRPCHAGARWPALRLEWRRSGKRQAILATVGQRSVLAQSWQTRLHLHLNVLHQGPTRWSPIAPALLAAARLTLPKPERGVHGMPRPTPAATANPPTRARHLARVPATMAWRTLHHRAPNTIGLFARQRRAHNADPARAQATSPYPLHAERQAPLAWKASPIGAQRVLLRTHASAAAPQDRSSAADVLLWQANAPALVWRKGGARRSSADAEPSVQASMLFAARTEAPAPAPGAAPAAPPAMATHAPVRQQLQAAALDPALTDRLADEVIRRVERSMRIERERRGH
jgi:hypothetical protein